ncbi:MAG: DsbA family protein, partial [Gammaproteobacteria bacterium]|nr:DsbA family protein [Gammaproteobacteria bacterium]
MTTTLVYTHDPMCSWCWAFRPVYDHIVRELPATVRLKRLLGGLAPDTDEPMPDSMREYVQGHWQRIRETVPGTRFNLDFWTRCNPRRATYPACRAVIAAREQSPEYDDDMTLAIQRAYYLEARNPSDNNTLIDLAGEIGLDRNRFTNDLESTQTMNTLKKEISEVQNLGLDRFPSLAMLKGG